MQGHSVLRKLDSDGKVGTTQTLHNLNEGLLLLCSLTVCLTTSRVVKRNNDGYICFLIRQMSLHTLRKLGKALI
jgi:hypothetical protein